MIRLTDLVLESTPAEEAERMGLERKPGFGNYGPVGKDEVTHRSRGGKLVPVEDTKGQGVGRGAGKAKPSGRKAPPPEKKEPTPPPAAKPPETTPTPEPAPPKPNPYQTRSAEKGGPRKLADLLNDVPEQPMDSRVGNVFTSLAPHSVMESVWESLGVEGYTPDKVFAYTDTSLPLPQNFERHEIAARNGWSDAAGLYDIQNNNIWMSPDARQWYSAARARNPESFNVLNVMGVHVLIHESVHSVSKRMKPDQLQDITIGGSTRLGSPLLASYDGMMFEEGLTEFLARRMSRAAMKNMGVPEPILFDNNYPAYTDFVNGVRRLATYGGLEPEKVFHTVTDPSELRRIFWEAENKTLIDVLGREAGASARTLQRILDAVATYEKRDKADMVKTWYGNEVTRRGFAMMNGEFQSEVFKIVRLARQDAWDHITEDSFNRLITILNFLPPIG